MLCPICNTELRIVRTRFRVEGDHSENTETRLFNVPVLICSNPRCPAQGEEQEGEPIPLELCKD